MSETKEMFKEKTILITGGTGSFGKACARILLSSYQPKKVIIFSRDEWKQWEMRKEAPFQDPRMRYFLGDVRDLDRLKRAFSEVDLIIHAAALKQVPIAEYNPSEFVKTNVNGAINVVEAAIYCGVKKVIALSTDKACNPINLYGATKLCSDKLFVNGNVYVGHRGFPIFSVVRYGNVLGSRGSIIPFWKELLEKGETHIPITDPDMTRFWITLPQAVYFVLERFFDMKGGEIFIPKIPSMKITDLGKALAPGLEQVIIGVRPGEKLHEMMINEESASHTAELSDHYIIVPKTHALSPEDIASFLQGKKHQMVAPNFSYRSDTNTKWLSQKDLLKTLSEQTKQ